MVKPYLLIIFCSITYMFQALGQNDVQITIPNNSNQQIIIGNEEGMCFTDRIALNKREPKSYSSKIRLRGSRSTDWSVNDGYGGGCTHDCTATSALSCNNGSLSKYRVPVVFTVSTTTSCGGTVVTQANIDAQLNKMNDYLACQNVPIEFYKSTTYSGHPTTGDMSTQFADLGCNFDDASVCRPSNVVNIFVFYNTGFSSGCNGYAYLPTGPGSPNEIVIARSCLSSYSYTQGTMNCSSTNLGISVVLIHEFGHILGLHHTHNENNPTKECPNGSNCCTGGDYICDTDADPGLHTGCVTGSGCNKNPSGCASPCGIPYPADINTENNIMSYNNLSGCRTQYTPCQKAKMVDALLCARGEQLCSRDVDDEFANGILGTQKDICVGGSAPTFTATSDCYNWYSGLGANATLLLSGSASFTPTIGTGSGQLNNNVSGTYTWYLGDENEVNPDCRTRLTVFVNPSPGTGTTGGVTSYVSNSCSTSVNVPLTTNATSFPANKLVGWWVTQGSPISSTVTNNATLTTALSTAQINTPLSNTANHIYASTSGTPLKNYTLPFNCGPLDEGKVYYATPVLSTSKAEVAPQTCSGTQGNLNNITFNGYAGKYRSVPPSSFSCAPNPMVPPTSYDITVTISGYTGAANQLGLYLLTNGTSGNQLFLSFSMPGNGSYTFNQCDFGDYNPAAPGGTTGFTAIAWQQGGSGMASGNVTISSSITFPGSLAIPFPSLNQYTSCLFGSPVQITCPCSCLPTASITTTGYSGYSCPSSPVVLNGNPTTNFNYLWSTAATTSSITVTPALPSTYMLTVTHQNLSCTSSSSVTINVKGTTVQNQLDSGQGSLRSVIGCLPSGGGTVSFNALLADTVYLDSPLLFNKNTILSGNGNIVLNLDLTKPGFNSATYGLGNAASNSLTLQNLKIYQTGNSLTKAILRNFGLMTWNAISITGSSYPYIVNENGSSVTTINTNIIRKL